MANPLPRYDELPVAKDRPPGSSWGLWGDDDQLGAINLLTPDRVQAGLRAAHTGRVFSLNWQLELPSPPLYGREPLRHTIFAVDGNIRDDRYDDFYPQGSSQWDSLSHVGHPEYGFYNGRTAADFTGRPGTKNGIEHWARRGIVGRGVLLDAAAHLAAEGRPLDPAGSAEITPDDLRATARRQGTTLEVGDILLIRTGWLGWYDELGEDERVALARAGGQAASPGPSSGEDMARFLWDNHVAAVATDTGAFEAWPHEMRTGPGGYAHFDVIALLGIPIGEMFVLDELAADCAMDGRYEFLLTSAPLNKLGGVGSPPNALAIK
jgi:kynurenine formamidase